MASSHLTLAALATSAVAGLDIVQASPHTNNSSGRFETAALVIRDGSTLLIRIPNSPEAETEQSADLVALGALTAGFRGRLPFGIPEVVGQTPYGQTRAIVYDYLAGAPLDLRHLATVPGLSESIGRAIAAAHSLPISVVTDAGLPVVNAAESAKATKVIVDKAARTGKVPSPLLARWSTALDDSALWQFQPTVINGSLSPENILVSHENVTAVLGWSGLRVGDPANDLFWLSSAPSEESATQVYTSYNRGRPGPLDKQLRKRARLYAELEIAKWLLHGVALRDDSIIDDAVSMLASLESTVEADLINPLSTDTSQVMALDEVEDLLDRTPRTSPLAARDHINVSGISDD